MGKSNECQGYESERMMLLIATLGALLSLANAACSESLHSAPKVREAHEISKKYETTSQSSDGSQGSSSGREAVLERVIAVQEGGVELEFDLPKEATAEDRVRSWQFPVRVFRANDGSMRLLNRPELKRRNDEWLNAAGLTSAACGHWIFTWNAFRIDCDPESAIKLVEAFDLRSAGIREGAAYQDSEAGSPGTLKRKSADPDGATFAVVMEIDADAVRRGRAESDVAVGEMTQKPVTLDAALRERAKEDVSGTISVTIDTDPAGNIQRRARVTSIETKRPDGESETQTVTETVERRSVSGPPAGR